MSTLHATRASLEELSRRFLGVVEPFVTQVTPEGRGRLLNALYHHSRGTDRRLEGAGARSAAIGDLVRESRRWTRGLYLLALGELTRLGVEPTEEPPPAIRAHEAWWASHGRRDDDLACGALLVEPPLLVLVGRRARLLRAASWRVDPGSPIKIPASIGAPTARTVDGASAACALWLATITEACRGVARAA